MPGAVPLTSSHALTHATLPFGLALADHGLAALARDPHLRNGLNVHNGRITHRAVAESLNLDFADPDQSDGGVRPPGTCPTSKARFGGPSCVGALPALAQIR